MMQKNGRTGVSPQRERPCRPAPRSAVDRSARPGWFAAMERVRQRLVGWRLHESWNWLVPFAGAAALTTLALLLTLLIWPVVQSPSLLFLAAVMVSAWAGGLGPGFVATILSTAALEMFFLPPVAPIGAVLGRCLQLCLFVLVSVLISSLNARRKRLAEQLRRQDRNKDTFLGILAHELRTPLSTISTALPLLRHSKGERADVEEICDVVHRQTQYMAHLINDLLDLARISQGKLQLQLQTVELSRVATQAAESVRSLFETRGQSLVVIQPAAPIHLQADPTRLHQIVTNLLNNAARYTPEGGHVALSIERAGFSALLRVRDNGVGIAPELLPTLFDLYTQAENGAKGGLGIGLNLVQRLVHLHQGTIHVMSLGPGQGSEFIVRLPLPAAVPGEANGHNRSAASDPNRAKEFDQGCCPEKTSHDETSAL